MSTTGQHEADADMPDARAAADKRATDRDRALVAALVGGATTAEAAAAVGVSANTIYRRLRVPAVRALLADAKALQWAPAAAELRAAVLDAVWRLRHLMAHAGHESTQVRAAVALIDAALAVKKVVDDAADVASIDARLAEAGV